MILSNLSWLSTKASKTNGEESRPSWHAARASRITPGRGQLCAFLLCASGKTHPLSGPQSPHLCAKKGWPDFSVHSSSCRCRSCPPSLLVLALPPFPPPKRGKETCVRCRGRPCGSELSGCAGCCRENEARRNPRTEKSHLPGNHSYPGHTSNPNTARSPAKDHPRIPSGPLPAQRPAPAGASEREGKSQRPHCAEVETEADGGDCGTQQPARLGLDTDRAPGAPSHSGSGDPSASRARGVSTWERPRAEQSLWIGAHRRCPLSPHPIPQTEKLRPSEGPAPARDPP